MGDVSNTADMPAHVEVIDLSLGWSFKQTDDIGENAWGPVKKIPSTVHQDLMDNQKCVPREDYRKETDRSTFRLKDPFIGFNEIAAEWVGLRSWTYRTKLARTPAPTGSKVVLAFDGLDTFAHVRLDGNTILKSDNMFLPHRIDITEAIQSKADHDLEVEFDSAFLRAREIKDRHPDHKYIAFNGDPARLTVRKAQYHWGWDWGPLLMCAGIWKPVRLEIYAVRISDVRTDIDVSADHKLATIEATAAIEGIESQSRRVQATFTVALGDKVLSSSTAHVSPEGKVSAQLRVADPELWMPNGYGRQPLYTVGVTVDIDGAELHTETRRVGLRKIELVQKPDSHGNSFYFRVNDVDIFCGGSCWIPTDSFLTNVSPEKYRAWIELMVPANQKMIR